MAIIREDRVQETTITTGAGSITLAGAVTGYRTFASVMVNNDMCEYVIDGGSTGEWEVGFGTWTTGNVFVRTKVERTSTGGNTAIAFSAGTKKVFMAYSGARNLRPVKLGFLGDSAFTQQSLNGTATPEKVKEILNGSGITNIDVKNLSVNGSTWFRTYNSAVFGSNSALTEMIAWKPDAVICSFGFNDIIAAADGRTLAQVKADADVVFDTLKSALPGASLIYAAEVGYDRVHWPTANGTLKNKSITAYAVELAPSGVTQGLYCSEMLDTVLSAPSQNAWANLDSMETYVKSRPNVTANIQTQIWKCHRLGLTDTSLGHQSALGHQFLAAGFVRSLANVASFTALVPRLTTQFVSTWQSPDDMFTFYLTPDGLGGWARSANIEMYGINSTAMGSFYGPAVAGVSPQEYYYPFKTKFRTFPASPGAISNSIDSDGYLFVMLQNGPPGCQMFVSINSGAFQPTGANTDNAGNYFEYDLMGNLGLGAGTYTIRWKAGTELYGPSTYTLTALRPSPRSHFGQGNNIISAAIIAPGGAGGVGNYFVVTGTNTINRITTTGWFAGTPLALSFPTALTLNHANTVSGQDYPMLLLNGQDRVLSANDLVMFILDSSVLAWREINSTAVPNPVVLNSLPIPSTPPSNIVKLFCQDIAGRPMMAWVDANGVNEVVEPHIAFNRVARIHPNNGAVLNSDLQVTQLGTFTTPALASTNITTSTKRFTIPTTTVAGNVSGLRTNVVECWRGNAAGLGGYFLSCTFCFDVLQTGQRFFIGLQDTVSAPTNVDPVTSVTIGKMGVAANASTGNMNFVTNLAGGAPTVTALGANFPINTTSLYELTLFCAPNSPQVSWRVKNIGTGNFANGAITTNFPANTTFLAPHAWITNNATAAAASIAVARLYLSSIGN